MNGKNHEAGEVGRDISGRENSLHKLTALLQGVERIFTKYQAGSGVILGDHLSHTFNIVAIGRLLSLSDSSAIPWTEACQAPLSMGFSRIFPIQGSNLHLLHWRVDSSPLSHQGSPLLHYLKFRHN